MARRAVVKVGDADYLCRTVTKTDIKTFAIISGDDNDIHFGEGAIAHGVLLASYISALIGMRLPGPDSVLLDLHLSFLSPARPDNTLVIRGEIIDIRKTGKGNKAVVKLYVEIHQYTYGTPVVTGTALVMLPINRVVLPEPKE